MRIEKHIERLRAECSRIQEHGHLEGLPDGYAAVSDIEIRINDLAEAVEQQINSGKGRHDG